MNAMALVSACDWTGAPAHRPLTGLGQGLVIGKGFAPRECQQTADQTYATADAIWRHAQRTRARGVIVEAWWTDVCGHRHLLFRNGLDCRLLSRATATASRYQQALDAAPARMAAIAAGHEEMIELTRHGRDVAMGEWTDPIQKNRFSKTPEKVRGFRRIDVLVLLHRRGTLNKDHLGSGFRLRDDYEISEGARPGSERSEVRSTAPAGGPADAQVAAVGRFRDAVQAVGQRLCTLMLHVVIQNKTISDWAEPRGVSASVATGYLIAGLDRLTDHYADHVTHDDPRVHDA